jgi:RNA polymerase sigma-70 factor (ECF subfamily)
VTPGTTTLYLQGCLDRLRAGEPAARDDLLSHSRERLLALTARMLSRYPRLRRWEEPDDVLQNALLRVGRMLDQVEVASVGDYLRLAATNIRRELLDLIRHHYGPRGGGANHATPPPGGAGDPAAESSGGTLSLTDWTEFHERAGRLPDGEREVFDLLYYHALTQEEAAEVLGISLSTLKRRWQSARLALMESLGGRPPD